ncbi:MAG: hypothetical protein WB680_15455 [Candidatus Acidiferrales bacterium]
MRRITVLAAPGVTGYWLSRAVAAIPEIEGVAKAVLRALADHYPNVWPSVGTIAAESGWGDTATKDAISLLVRDGWMAPVGTRRGGRNNSEQYIISVQKIVDATSLPLPSATQTSRQPTPSKIETSRQPTPSDGNQSRGGRNQPPGGEEVIIEENNKQSCANSVRHDSDPSSFSAAKECVQRVWDYYISKLNKNPRLLSFTLLRQKKAHARLREAMVKTGGDMDRAENLLMLAIDTMAASKFHRGENETGKPYDSWEKHLFPSQEKLEWWWERCG